MLWIKVEIFVVVSWNAGGLVAANKGDDEQDRKRNPEQPQKGIPNLPAFADELFDGFHSANRIA